jgi:hypothetical protein
MRATRRLATLIALAAPVLLMASTADAVGPGPIWQSTWPGNGTPDGVADGSNAVWTGDPSYVAYPGNTDGDDQGFQFTGSNFLTSDRLTSGNFGTEDFDINFPVTTSMTYANVDLMSARGGCFAGAFWQVRMVDGTVQFEVRGTDQVSTIVTSPGVINDGVSHNIDIQRVGNDITLTIDETPVASTTVQGTGDYVVKTEGLRVGGGNGCTGAGSPALQPLVGSIDYVGVIQRTDHDGQDLLLEEPVTPVVPAGGSGEAVINRTNNSASDTLSATATFTAPAGVTFTGVSDLNNTCVLVDPTTVTCGPVEYGPGPNPVTIAFDTDPSLAPGSVVNITGNFVNHENADPDSTNNLNVPLPIQIASTPEVPLVDPAVGAATLGGIGVLAAGGFMWRRRRQTVTG